MTAELIVRVEAPAIPDIRPRGYVDQQRRSDVDRAVAMFAALGLGETSDEMWMVTVPGAPYSKSRPRFSRNGHAYRAAGEQDAETRTASYLRRVVTEPLTGNVGIVCLFFRPNRQRIDADNLIKHVCDSANGVLWVDDSQCTAVMGIVELDAERPRTVVVIGRHISTMQRGTDALAICEQCGKPYKAKTTKQRRCSRDCQADYFRDRPKPSKATFSSCSACGKQLTHNRGGMCRPCFEADRDANAWDPRPKERRAST